MRIIQGYLTATNRKHIKAILSQGLMSGRINRIEYFLTLINSTYTVKIVKMDRGLIPCPGSKLRLSTYVATFKI